MRQSHHGARHHRPEDGAGLERARADRLRREAMDRYWQSVCEALPKPSEWPCTADRRCMASHHQESCPIRIAELIKGKK